MKMLYIYIYIDHMSATLHLIWKWIAANMSYIFKVNMLIIKKFISDILDKLNVLTINWTKFIDIHIHDTTLIFKSTLA